MADAMGDWAEVARLVLPRSGRFFAGDRTNRRTRRNDIKDSTGTRAHRVLGAGLMSGNTSPARPWFRITTPDPKPPSGWSGVRRLRPCGRSKKRRKVGSLSRGDRSWPRTFLDE